MGPKAPFELSSDGRRLLRDLLKGDGAPTQGQLAKHAGCSRQFISDLVLGKKTGCSKDIAYAIERCLHQVAGSLFVPRDSPDRTVALSAADGAPTTVPA